MDRGPISNQLMQERIVKFVEEALHQGLKRTEAGGVFG
jgi:hypothetical protein